MHYYHHTKSSYNGLTLVLVFWYIALTFQHGGHNHVHNDAGRNNTEDTTINTNNISASHPWMKPMTPSFVYQLSFQTQPTTLLNMCIPERRHLVESCQWKLLVQRNQETRLLLRLQQMERTAFNSWTTGWWHFDLCRAAKAPAQGGVVMQMRPASLCLLKWMI